MTAARWDRLPPQVKRAAKRPRAKALRGSWRCVPCGQVITDTWAKAQAHSDEHGGGRLECVLK